MSPWLIDPVSKKESVSLTMLVFSLTILVLVGLLNVFGKIGSVGPFENLFFSTTALYFSRRLNINGKSYQSDKGEGKEE